MLAKVFEIDVSKCQHCNGEMSIAEFPLNVPPNFLASCTSRKAYFEPTGVGETDDEKGNFHWYTMAVKPEDYLP